MLSIFTDVCQVAFSTLSTLNCFLAVFFAFCGEREISTFKQMQASSKQRFIQGPGGAQDSC